MKKLVERARYLREWTKQHEQSAVMTDPTSGLALGEKEGRGDRYGGGG